MQAMKKRIFLTISILVFMMAAAFCVDCGISLQGIEYNVSPSPYPFAKTFFSDAPPTGPAMREPDMVWVENTLSAMTLDEKVGQMLMPDAGSNPSTSINTYKVGGFIFTGNNRKASDLISITNKYQALSPIPLLYAIDSEAGLGARVADATIFPLIMGMGATNNPAFTEACGKITARESRALGIHIGFGPVVDVNTEPINPIISTRAYSDDPGMVMRLTQGYITGARKEGLLCTFKHYPGHGTTQGDSHNGLYGVNIPFEQLRRVHIKPYEDLAAQKDIDLVMTALVWYTAVYPEKAWPATLSPIFNRDILRNEIKYNGLLISDAYTMQGLAEAIPDIKERVVAGVEAGLDIILMPPDMARSHTGIKEAVESGRIPLERIEQSVRRILIAKSRVGLPERKIVDTKLYPQVLRHPAHQAKVREVCECAFSCGKYDLPTTPPLASSDRILLLDLERAGGYIFYIKPSSNFINPFKTAFPQAVVMRVPSNASTVHNSIIQDAVNYDKIVVICYDWTKMASETQVALVNDLAKLSVPVIYISFGAPYHYMQIPNVDAFYCGYSSVEAMQEVAVEVLSGKREAIGRIPVCVPGLKSLCNSDGWLFYEEIKKQD